jgi:hypothetical protein
MDTTTDQKFLRVIDSSVTEEYPKRVHEIVLNGTIIEVPFTLGVPTILPFEQGIKFMKDGFKVEATDGSSLDLPVIPTDNVVASLAKDECVAKFSELRIGALKLRAAQRHGGEIFASCTDQDRKELVSFLSDSKIGEDETVADTVDGEDDLIDDEDEDETSTFTVDEVQTATDGAIALLADYGIELSAVTGTGKNGNVLVGDVKDYIEKNSLSPLDQAI